MSIEAISLIGRFPRLANVGEASPLEGLTTEAVEAFLGRIAIGESDACWLWQGATSSNGYGNAVVSGLHIKAARVMWEIAFFPPPPGMSVFHECGTRACLNPAHLRLGAPSARIASEVLRQTPPELRLHSRGDRNPNSRLTPEAVLSIRARYAAGEANQYELAEQFGVSQPTIGQIVRRQTWSHL